MSKRFFRLADDVTIPHRWDLDPPTDRHGRKVDDREFRKGVPVRVEERLRIPVEVPGKPLAFTEAGISIPLVHTRVASIFSKLAPDDVQLIPVDVEGQSEQYFILVATRIIRCIDEQASRIEFWTPKDGLPHKVGQYSSVRDMRVDKSKVGSAKVFRCEGWKGPLIISEEIKNALDHLGATGTRYEEV